MHVIQNQSFSSFAPLICVFLVTASCKSVLNYVLKMVIIFAFCMISLPHSSRYVLIDISNLTPFLCHKLFVMSSLISSENGKFHECSRNSLTITVNYSLLMVKCHHKIPVTPCYSDFRERSQNLRKLPCGTAFCEDFYPFNPTLWGTTWAFVAVLANFANVLKTRVAFCRTQHPCSLNY